LTFYSQIKSTKTVVPVYAGTTIIAPLDPVGNNKIQALTLLDPYSDGMTYVSVDGNLSLKSFYSDGSTLLDENYNPVSFLLLETGNGVIINTGSDKLWTYQTILSQ
jgi:hypothetical protein